LVLGAGTAANYTKIKENVIKLSAMRSSREPIPKSVGDVVVVNATDIEMTAQHRPSSH
jgi:hypothetical protein